MKKTAEFTLIEVMVVIAVFVMMMAMLLEFLTGAQRVWQGTRGRGETFVESKAGMDFIVSLLDNIVVNTDYKGSGSTYRSSYFVIMDDDLGDTSDYADRVRFFTRSTVLGARGVYWVEIFRDGSDTDGDPADMLKFKFLDAETAMPQADVDEYLNIETYWQDVLDAEAVNDQYIGNSYTVSAETVLERVTSFYVITGNKDGSSIDWERENTSRFPSALMINIGMMTPEDYEIYVELEGSEKSDFKAEKEMSFSRMIYFDQAEARGRGQE